jgi:hypothetical protein
MRHSSLYRGVAYEEVGILLHTSIVPLAAVSGDGIPIKVAARDPVSHSFHLCKQCAVEAVVVAVRGKVVVAGQRGVGFELVVAVETGLASQKGECSSAGCRVATDAQPEGRDVASGFDAQYSKGDGQVVTDVVNVLLGVDELSETCDSVVREEVVLGDGVSQGSTHQMCTGRLTLAAAFKPGHGPRMSLGPGGV